MLLGIELRGSEVGLTVVSRRGEILAYQGEPMATPMDEWWGTHPDERYRSVLRLLESARKDGVYQGAQVAGIGLTAESGLVFLDLEHQAIAPRTMPWSEWLDVDNVEATSDIPSALACWAQNGKPASVGVVFSTLDYLRFRLTGALATHVHFAWSIGLSRDGDLANWDHEAVDALGIRPDSLPPILSADCRVGVVSEELVEASGVSRGVWVNAGSDPLSARLLVAAEPTEDRRVLYFGSDGQSAWTPGAEPSEEFPSLPTPVGTWFHERELGADFSDGDLDEHTVVDSDDADILESLGLSEARLVTVDAGGPSAGAAIQAGLGLGWWRDLRTLWRKRRHPISYEQWCQEEEEPTTESAE